MRGRARLKGELHCTDLLYIVFCPAGKSFTHMETSLLPVKGCKIYAFAPAVTRTSGFAVSSEGEGRF
jgi:hypothetical protein